jgi:predicted AAA+ superfamily ATPase
MISRDILPELIESAGEYPVVTVFGPRQSGKTTLVRSAFPNKAYTSLENPDIRLAAETDPRTFLNEIPDGAILDEIQRLPVLLSYIQGIVDEHQKAGMFILTGSHQPDVHQAVSQTLAGRTALLTLLPLSIAELLPLQEPATFNLIVNGSFPRLRYQNLSAARFFNGYVQTYVERDVRSLLKIKDLDQFQRFLQLLAGRVGQVVNYASLGNDIGLSGPSVKKWIGILKASFIVFELQPFFENIGKRVVKSPKIYFTDTGLLCYLLGIETADQAARDPLRGGLYENLVILDILKTYHNRGKRPPLHFFRDSHGVEVDLLIRERRQLVPVEIKSAQTFTKAFLKGIQKFRTICTRCAEKGFVFYDGDEQFQLT